MVSFRLFYFVCLYVLCVDADAQASGGEASARARDEEVDWRRQNVTISRGIWEAIEWTYLLTFFPLLITYHSAPLSPCHVSACLITSPYAYQSVCLSLPLYQPARSPRSLINLTVCLTGCLACGLVEGGVGIHGYELVWVGVRVGGDTVVQTIHTC